VSSAHEILQDLRHDPKRSLGQNFLVDAGLAQCIVGSLELCGGELVCEIGPGTGALTDWLAKLADAKALQIIALEKDRNLSKFLARRFSANPQVKILEADAMEWDWRNLCGPQPAVLVGNLPYNISTVLIQKFGAPVSPLQKMVLTVQKEVAARICAEPNTKDYGSLSVLIQRFWKTEFLRILPPGVFHPRPNVDSALIRLTRRPNHEIGRCDATVLERLLHAGFGQRRKQLCKLLQCSRERWADLAAKLAFRVDTRAQGLSVDQWQLLAAALSNEVPDHSPPGSEELFDVVDEEDRVVEVLPRAQVHAGSLRHRAAHILLRNRAGEIFLQRRAPWKDINPGVWDSSAAGHMDAGETYEAAAHRELIEELGVDTDLRKIGKLMPCEATGQEFIEVFLGEHEGPFHLAGLEIVGGAFFSPGQILSWSAARPQEFSPVFLLCLPMLLEEALPS